MNTSRNGKVDLEHPTQTNERFRAFSFCQNWPARPVSLFAKKMQEFGETIA